MSGLVLIPMPGNELAAQELAGALPGELGAVELRAFPDGESYLRLPGDVAGRSLAIVCTLARPNDRILPLLFAANTARELGAVRIGLVAPYLGYMRQDRRFKPGEAVTSRQVAELLSDAFDWLVTADPHLHRYHSLNEIYRIPSKVVHAAPLISQWVKQNVVNPAIIGPDSESEQWVSAVANDAGAPFTVLEKTRRGDRDVSIAVKNWDAIDGRTPVLVDDIVSSGRTMLEAVRLLRARALAAPVCVAVHGIFADDSDRLLVQAGARVVTSNSIVHRSNAIDLTAILANAIRDVTGPSR